MKRFPLVALCAAALMSSCSHKVAEPVQTPPTVAPRIIGGDRQARALPRATVYRMAGDATAANVPVQIDAAGNIVSFPAPSDVKGQEPIPLSNGYLLDRRGINMNSRFTRYTYAEYGALKSVPSIAELKAAIIPGARPVDIIQLDITPAEAAADTAAVVRLLRNL